MSTFRFSEVAQLMAVSDDTVRRWVDNGRLSSTEDSVGRKVVDGAELATFAKARARSIDDPSGVARSARNQFVGLVTEVTADKVMAQVEMQCGPYRVVSLMSTEAVQELGLAPGVLAVAVVKSTSVVVEVVEASGQADGPPAKRGAARSSSGPQSGQGEDRREDRADDGPDRKRSGPVQDGSDVVVVT